MNDLKWLDAGGKLKELRKKTNLSIFKVAKKINISGNYLSLLERGVNAPSDAVIISLAEFYNIDPQIIFKWYGKIIPPTSEQLDNVPSLKKIITDISVDPRLTDTEKEEFAKRVYEIANELFGGDNK